MSVRFPAMATLILLLACGGNGGGTDSGPGDPGPEVPGDVPAADVPADAVPDLPGDVAPDAPPSDAGCTEGAKRCSDDAYRLLACDGGAWVTAKDCLAAEGRLCEAEACVDPWRYGDPQWGTCADDPRATPETLAQKAAFYDAIASRLHIHPQLRWAAGVTLKSQEVACPDGKTPPCLAPVKPYDQATWEDVAAWHSGENDGLWSALYLTSQAFRHAVTKSPEALDTLRTLLAGEVDRMKITGVPGVFTRQLIPPGVAGIGCPGDDAEYRTDPEKDDNRWVQIRDDGCHWVVDHTTGEWTKEPATLATPGPRCGLDAYKGYCWLDNVSQDEYAGHMLALGAIWKLVDDPDVRATAADLLVQVADHLRQNWLMIHDWDGRNTEHGKLHALSAADSPGFLSTMSMDYVLMGAIAGDRADLRAFYDDCLLQRPGEPCAGNPWDFEASYLDYVPMMILYTGPEGCQSNYNNFSMVLTSLHNLIWFERDPAVREVVQDTFDRHFMHEDGFDRVLIDQGNPWFNFSYAAQKRLGPDQPHALEAVEEGICALRQFPASKHRQARDTAALAPHYCEARLGGSQAEEPFPMADRCLSTFEWWGDPYKRETCTEDVLSLSQPGDFLLPYWMGRYYGFIPANL